MTAGALVTTRTTCPFCGVGCGVLAATAPDGTVTVKGDPDHPANFGRLCSKGSALAETIGLEGRLLHPEIGGARASWDAALGLVADTFARTIAAHGPDSVAFYVSGQLLTEDYYVANKLMKGFIGSANIDTNSRLCMASSVAGHRRAFGTDTVPGVYEDLDCADLVVLVGSNLAWCHPVLYQRLAAAKAARPGMQVVVVDPRATATAQLADLHLPLAPDSDVALFNGLLDYLAAGHADGGFVAAHTTGLDAALAAARRTGLAGAVRDTQLEAALVRRFYDLFARTEKVVTVYSQGVNQSVTGTDKVNAIINCHLLTGRIGRPGMGPFSVTGQPNAMGGRETGGLANQLAAHMELENPSHRRIVQDFWRSPVIAGKPGYKAVELFDAVGDGRVKALWIMATNPVDSLPNADAVAAALQACPFVVVSDVMRATDTTRHADVLLPAAAWGEKDGAVTNSERRISRQRAFLPLPGEARPDWWITAQVAARMGFAERFAYASAADIFREHAALSARANGGARDFDIGGLATVTNAQYESLAPVQWPLPAGAEERRGAHRFFGDGRFYTPDGRARFVATPAGAIRLAGTAYPFVLNTGRVRDHWHTMTRTAKSARLSAHVAEPFCEIHPEDAAALGIAPATLVEVTSMHGRAIVRALPTDRQRRGSVYVPMHWTGQYASAGRVDALACPETDPVSGQPGLKHTPVRVRPFAAAWYGFAVVRRAPGPIACDYWALARAAGGWRVELAGREVPGEWTAFARGLFGDAEDLSENMLAYHDAPAGRHRFAAFDDGRLDGALFVGQEPVAVSRAWLSERLEADIAGPADRLRILAGRGGAGVAEPGAIVCGCFQIGVNQIAAAAGAQGCRSVDAVGAMLGAGTSCGSCRAEIQRIIHETRIPERVGGHAGD
ncbi:MAG: molybdopterin-dependent oxidoreductase [Alphaproteobacteria bacterium]|nr:molybdopterin-dependent oxidoreductase [Alphaproteobacteria bacterium]